MDVSLLKSNATRYNFLEILYVQLEVAFEGSLEGSFEGSEDWNLNIDDTSQEILQSRPAMVMGKCPMHCMGGALEACMHGFTNVAPSMSPIKSGYQCPPEAPKKLKNFIGPTPSTPERPLPAIKLNPFKIRPSISPIKMRCNYLFENPLLNDAEFDRLPAMWVTDPCMD